MNAATLVAEAFSSLAKNKIRSFLSMLGIVIGVGAVIAMVAIGEGAKARVQEEIRRMGDDWLIIGYWGMGRSGVRAERGMTPNATEEEARAMMRECSAIRAATPTNRIGMQAVSAHNNYSTSVYGALANYFDIRRWDAELGTIFTEEDSLYRKRVCVLGKTAARELFGQRNPIGEDIRLNTLSFRVIGVLEEKGNSGGRDNDDVILIPWETFKSMLAGNEISMTIYAAADHGLPLWLAKQQVRALLRQRHRLPEEADDDFRIMDRSLSAQADAQSTETFNALLMAIASISLIVGGVGIMNIMLVSVTERTREIGLRMAIGANGSHVLGQFLMEAVALCAIGGLLGFGVGALAAEIVQQKWAWPAVVSYWMAGVALAFACAVGLFFGFYPAWRASRLNPIDALRYE